MGAGNALAVLRQYGRAPGVTDGALTVLTFMALQTLDADPEPVYFGGRRRIAAGCRGADIDLQDPDSAVSKTDANRVSQCIGALAAAGAITQTRSGAARKAGRSNRDWATSAAYRLNISEDTRQWVRNQLRNLKTRPGFPGTSAEETPGNPGRVHDGDTRESRAGVAETRPEIPGTQRRSERKLRAEDANARDGETQQPQPRPEPPRQCPEHLNDPNAPRCRACRDARISNEAWKTERQQRIDTAEQCPDHQGQLARSCAPCRSERIGAA